MFTIKQVIKIVMGQQKKENEQARLCVVERLLAETMEDPIAWREKMLKQQTHLFVAESITEDEALEVERIAQLLCHELYFPSPVLPGHMHQIIMAIYSAYYMGRKFGREEDKHEQRDRVAE
jgi:hypothetical protein